MKDMRNYIIKSSIKITILVGLMVSFSSCGNRKGSVAPDVSHIDVAITIDRFDEALMQLDTSNLALSVADLYQQYPDFAPCYFQDIIGVARPGDTAWYGTLQRVLSFPGFRAAFDSVQVAYPSLASISAQLSQAFRYHRYYHPTIPVPKVRAYTSEYGYGAVACADTVLGIGLDLFLGADFSYYSALQIPRYLMHRMTPDYIVPGLMEVYWQSYVPMPERGATLLDYMLYYGKLLYYLDLVLPETADAYKIGFTSDQLAWAEQEEAAIWAYLLEKDRLYATNMGEYAYLLNEGPTTQGMPPESPGKIARWIGWQMVRTYRNKYADEPLADLWLLMDGQAVLAASGYKPGR